jgi:hypothetical protein
MTSTRSRIFSTALGNAVVSQIHTRPRLAAAVTRRMTFVKQSKTTSRKFAYIATCDEYCIAKLPELSRSPTHQTHSYRRDIANSDAQHKTSFRTRAVNSGLPRKQSHTEGNSFCGQNGGPDDVCQGRVNPIWPFRGKRGNYTAQCRTK